MHVLGFWQPSIGTCFFTATYDNNMRTLCLPAVATATLLLAILCRQTVAESTTLSIEGGNVTISNRCKIPKVTHVTLFLPAGYIVTFPSIPTILVTFVKEGKPTNLQHAIVPVSVCEVDNSTGSAVVGTFIPPTCLCCLSTFWLLQTDVYLFR